MASESRFSAADFSVFGVTLALSAGVGMYHAWKSARKLRELKLSRKASLTEGTDDFLMGGRQLPVGPVALSLMTTFVSGFSLLGVPAEVYQRGILMWVYQMMGAPALLICALLFLPIFYRLKPTSIYEYFEVRFGSRTLRRLAAALFLVNTLFYMAVVMYAPAVALSGVTGISTWPFILSVGVVCTFYTSLGGLKGVVWTDTLQSTFMYAGVLTLIVKGTMDAGGISRVFEINSYGNYNRLQPQGFVDPLPTQYFSIWIAIFGGLSFWMSLYGLNQMAVQRYCSLRNLRQAYVVIGLTAPAYIILLTLCSYIGLIMVAFFWDCDPLTAKEINTPDQLVIYFVTKTLGAYQGLPGLFLACMFSGTLSTVSSGINSMAAVTWEDFFKRSRFAAHMDDAKATLMNKLFVCVYGVCGMALAFAAGPMGGIINAAISMMGSLAGPLVGLFFLGVLFPIANKFGALVAALISMAVCIWVTMGSIIYKPYEHYKLPLDNGACSNSVVISNETNAANSVYGDKEVLSFYRISSFLFSLIGIVMVLILGFLVSYLWQLFIGKSTQTLPIEAQHYKMEDFTIFGHKKRRNMSIKDKIEHPTLTGARVV